MVKPIHQDFGNLVPSTLRICRYDLEALPDLTSQNATHAIAVDWL
jgi:hypothetical protein